MATYNTKQRGATEDFLRSHAGVHYTVDSLLTALENSGVSIGRTTVYRTLERLCDEGKVNKYSGNFGEGVCYQYVSDKECTSHFHLKCEGCGKLIHLECGRIEEIGAHIAREHGFKVNKLKTVFYGVCEECAGK